MNETVKKNYSVFIAPGTFSVEGVTAVTEYTDKLAVIKITGGILEINGSDISLIRLDTDKNTASFSGNVSALKIADKYVKSGFWGKMFR